MAKAISAPWADEETYCHPRRLRALLRRLLAAAFSLGPTTNFPGKILWQDAWAYMTQRYEAALAANRVPERAVWDRMLLGLYQL